MDVAKHRLKTMKTRVPRFRRFRKLGVSTSRLLRTGAKAAMTYGRRFLESPTAFSGTRGGQQPPLHRRCLELAGRTWILHLSSQMKMLEPELTLHLMPTSCRSGTGRRQSGKGGCPSEQWRG